MRQPPRPAVRHRQRLASAGAPPAILRAVRGRSSSSSLRAALRASPAAFTTDQRSRFGLLLSASAVKTWCPAAGRSARCHGHVENSGGKFWRT